MVSYLQLAHNERHPVTGSPVAKVIHNFGRADQVDRAALSRLVASISRFLDPAQAVAAGAAGEVEVLDSRRMRGAWVLARLWERPPIRPAALGRGARSSGRSVLFVGVRWRPRSRKHIFGVLRLAAMVGAGS